MKKNYSDQLKERLRQTRQGRKRVREKILEYEKRDAKDEPGWWKLDNAALIYPASTGNAWPGVFRIAAYLKEPVSPEVLQRAVDDIMPRFPFFNARLKKGFFYFYLEEQPFTPEIKEELTYPCRKFELDSKKHLIRIQYYNRRISVECFHSLSDGRGSTKFLTALLMRYFEIQGVKISGKENFVNYLDLPQPGEAEDAFARYADLKETQSRKSKVAYQIKGTPMEYGKQLNFMAIMSSAEVKSVAKAKGATLTEYLVARMMIAANEQRKFYRNLSRPISIQVPIDCRRFFPSETLRNFSSFKYILMPETDDFLEIVHSIRAQLAEIDAPYLMKNINANVKAAKYSQFVPLTIKNLGLHFSSWLFGERLSTYAISNVGFVSMPPEVVERVEMVETMLGRNPYNPYSFGCSTLGDKMCFTLTSKIKETGVYSSLLKAMADDGIDIKVISNKE